MAGLFDVYVLSRDRSKETVLRFLDHFLPRRRELADQYPVPRHTDPPALNFNTAYELLGYLEQYPDQAHAIYWASEIADGPRYAMIFPTDDGHAVYGLSTEHEAEELLARLIAFLGSSMGYVDAENPPPDNVAEFKGAVETFLRSR